MPCYANPLSGVAFYNTCTDTESYLIFSDGSRSDHSTTTDLCEFSETHFNQIVRPVGKIRVHFKNETSQNPGLFLGVQLLDFENKSIVKAGDWNLIECSEVSEVILV